MGPYLSIELTEEDIERYIEKTGLSKSIIIDLYNKFQRFNSGMSSPIMAERFFEIPDLASNPLLERCLEIFDTKSDSWIDFEEFIETIAIFIKPEAQQERIKFLFRVYDVNEDNYISNGDLFMILSEMVGENLTEIQIQQLVDKTIAQFDHDMDGKISFEEFCEAIEGHNMGEKLFLGDQL